MSQTAAEKAAMLQRVKEEEQYLRRMTEAHETRWPNPKPPKAPDRSELPAINRPPSPRQQPPAEFAAPMLAKIPAVYFGERRVARSLAVEHAERAYQQAVAAHAHAIAAYEQRVDERERQVHMRAQESEAESRLLALAFGRLENGNRQASERAVETTLSKLPVPGTLVGWLDDRPVIRVDVPDTGDIPERKLATTPGGKPTTKKRSQGEQNDALAEVVASVTLAAGRAALSAAPSTSEVEVVAVDPDGGVVAQCLLKRGSVAKTRNAIDDLFNNDGLISQSGRTRTLDDIEISDDRLNDLLSGRERHSPRSRSPRRRRRRHRDD